MIVKANHTKDFNIIFEIINDASAAYKGIIPEDRWKEPYMSKEELNTQIKEGVKFWSYIDNGETLGVMGIQCKKDVTLIRHAYVRTTARKKGIGGKLLNHLIDMTNLPVLIGTWADASWAISFYEKYNFRMVSKNEKNSLLKKYWSVPDRQIETSVVLVSSDWC